MIWLPLAFTLLWCLVLLWPRYDGGGIGFSLAAVVPSWFSIGPPFVVWAIYAAIHFAF